MKTINYHSAKDVKEASKLASSNSSFLAGGIGAVVIFSYLDLSSQGQNAEFETKILASEKVLSSLQLELKKNNY